MKEMYFEHLLEPQHRSDSYEYIKYTIILYGIEKTPQKYPNLPPDLALSSSRKHACIQFRPLQPHFYNVKVGFTG